MALKRPVVDYAGNLKDMADDDYIRPGLLGSGTPSADSILNGNGEWVSTASLNYWTKLGSDLSYTAGTVYTADFLANGNIQAYKYTGTENYLVVGVATSSYQFKVYTSPARLETLNLYGVLNTIFENGNHRIGTGSDSGFAKFQVNGAIQQSLTSSVLYANVNGVIVAATAGNINALLGNTSLTTNYVTKWNGTALANSLMFDNGTNVGIGTTSPNSKLQVATTNGQFSHFGTHVIGVTSTVYTGISFGYAEPDGTYRKSAIVQEQVGDGAARGTIHILNNGTNSAASATLADSRLAITSSGNVGIGTASPQQKQHNNISLGGVGVGLMLSNDATNATLGRGVGILFAGTGNANIAQIEAQTLTASNNTGGLIFKYSTVGALTEGFRLNHQGYLLLGSASVSGFKILQINGGIRQTDVISGLVYANGIGEFQLASQSDLMTTLGDSAYIKNQNSLIQTGNFRISGTGQVALLLLDQSASNSYAELQFRKAGILHFDLYTYTDAASNLYLTRYGDAGEYLGNVFTVYRATGNISLVSSLGVGIATPLQKIHTSGSIRMSSSSAMRLEFDKSDAYFNWIESDGIVNTNYMRFAVANTEVMRITSSSIIGMGVVNPAAGTRLHITGLSSGLTAVGTVSNRTLLISNSDAVYGLHIGVFGTGSSWLQSGRSDSAVTYDLWLQHEGGNVILGNTGSVGAYKLQVTGTIYNSNLVGGTEALVKTSTLGIISRASAADISTLLGAGYYIQNQTSLQTANFNISSYGIIDTVRIWKGNDAASIFIGNSSGNNTQTGSSNTGLGQYTLNGLTTGNSNTVVGHGSGFRVTTGAQNSFYGLYTGFYTTTGGSNNVFGGYALHLNTTGSYNTAIGQGALYSNTTGSYSVAIGQSAMYYMDNVGNQMNIGIGYIALRGSGTVASNIGTANTAIGHYNQYQVTSGNNNTSIGYYTLIALTTGSGNTSIGTYALVANISGSWNTGVGYQALSSITTGGYNTSLGINSGNNITTGSYNVIIGSLSGASIATASNYMLFGDGQGNERFRVDNSGRVGIGLTVITRKFEVKNSSGDSQNMTLMNNDWVSGTTGTSLQFATGAASGNTYYKLQTLNSGETAAGNLVLQLDGGKLLIGIASSNTYKAYINGGGASSDGLYVDGHIRATGNIIADGFFSGTSSDRRYKSDFKAITVIDKIDQIDVNSYQHFLYKRRMIGSIAQDIEKLFPELVYQDDNKMYRLYDNGYAAIALQLGKEIKSEVDILRDRVKELEKQVAYLSK